jgi:DNA-directed RNA polymerase beta subunit
MDATAFEGMYEHSATGVPTIEQVQEMLTERFGFCSSGWERLHDPFTGEMLDQVVCMGPVTYKRLKHLAEDKLYARSKGRIMSLSRQPNEGRANGGALRFGEMERDCILSHGAAKVMQDRTVENVDAFNIDICTKCGDFATNSRCPTHGITETKTIKTRYAMILLIQELRACGIAVNLLVT